MFHYLYSQRWSSHLFRYTQDLLLSFYMIIFLVIKVETREGDVTVTFWKLT